MAVKPTFGKLNINKQPYLLINSWNIHQYHRRLVCLPQVQQLFSQSPSQVKRKTKVCISCCSIKHAALRSRGKTGWFGIGINLLVEGHVYPQTVVSVSWHYKTSVVLVQRHHHHFIEMQLVLAMMQLENEHSLLTGRILFSS